jgi:flagellar FliJ protein
MAADLKVLIRLADWQVDEKRRALGELFALRDDLDRQAAQLEQDLAREQAAAAHDTLASLHYGHYARQVIERRERLAESIARMEHEIAKAQDALADAYLEQKKYEIADAARERRAAEAAAREEQIILDEIGQEGFRRRSGRLA